MITNSPAFKEDGLLIVTFDEGGLAFDGANSRITAQGVSCCAQQPGPNICPLSQEISRSRVNLSPPNPNPRPSSRSPKASVLTALALCSSPRS